MCTDDYKKNCNREIDFDVVYNNIKFLWENKQEAEIYIRTLRFEVEGRKQEYYEMFKNLSDYIAIDNAVLVMKLIILT